MILALLKFAVIVALGIALGVVGENRINRERK